MCWENRKFVLKFGYFEFHQNLIIFCEFSQLLMVSLSWLLLHWVRIQNATLFVEQYFPDIRHKRFAVFLNLVLSQRWVRNIIMNINYKFDTLAQCVSSKTVDINIYLKKGQKLNSRLMRYLGIFLPDTWLHKTGTSPSWETGSCDG